MTLAQKILHLYTAFVFGAGCWLLVCYGRKYTQPTRHIATWNISGLAFSLMLWALFAGILIAQGSMGALLEYYEQEELSPAWGAFFSSIAMHGSILLLMFVAWIGWKKDIFSSISAVPYSIGKALCQGVLAFVMAMPIIWVCNKAWVFLLSKLHALGIDITAEPQNLVEVIAETNSMLPTLLMGVLAVCIAPITEEVVFRGIIYRYFKGRVESTPALLLSALLFACMHFNLLSFLPLFLLGVILGLSYEWSGNIGVPIAFHAFFNLNTYLVILIQPETIEGIGCLLP